MGDGGREEMEHFEIRCKRQVRQRLARARQMQDAQRWFENKVGIRRPDVKSKGQTFGGGLLAGCQVSTAQNVHAASPVSGSDLGQAG